MDHTPKHQMGHYSNIAIAAMLGFIPFVGLILAVVAFILSFNSYMDGSPLWYALYLFIFTMSVALFCFVTGWVFIANRLAQYHFSEKGLLVKYPLEKEKFIPWEDFQEVSICYTNNRANTVLRCVKKGEKKNFFGEWKFRNPFRYRSVIQIDYNPSVAENISKFYPKAVVDMRY